VRTTVGGVQNLSYLAIFPYSTATFALSYSLCVGRKRVSLKYEEYDVLVKRSSLGFLGDAEPANYCNRVVAARQMV